MTGDRTPTGDLRERLERALTAPDCPCLTHDGPCVEHLTDAVLPVVEAALTRARASCCEDGDRTYAEMERHLTQRAEEAERQRAEALAAVEQAREALPFFKGQLEGVRELYPVLAQTLTVTYGRLRDALDQPEGT